MFFTVLKHSAGIGVNGQTTGGRNKLNRLLQKRHFGESSMNHLVCVSIRPVAAAVSLALSMPVPAGVITVDGTSCTLQDAIVAANTNSPLGGCSQGSGAADTLNLTAAAYTLDSVDANKSYGWNGLPLVTSKITINGDPDGNRVGAIIQRSSASGTPSFRLLAVAGGSLTLKYVTLSGGRARPVYDDFGYTFYSDPGGAAAVFSGSLKLDHSVVTNNHSSTVGGGVYVASTARLLVRDSLISGNVTSAPGYHVSPPGGGIFGSANVSRSSIVANIDGAISARGNILLKDSIVRENESAYYGSTIYSTFGTIRLIRSAVSNNQTDRGMPIIAGKFRIQDSTISGNYVGFAAQPSVVGSGSVRHSTIVGNIGGGVDARLGSTIANSLIVNNTSSGYPGGSSGPDCEGVPTLQGLNRISDGGCGGIPGTANLGPLLNNGGTTPTHALMTGSPAIDAAATGFCPGTDQRRVKRPQGAGCDIGAFERITAVHSSVSTIIAHLDSAVAAGTLTGTGPSAQKAHRIQAVKNKVLTAGQNKQVANGAAFCDELIRTLDRVDPDGASPDANDYLTGPAAPQVIDDIGNALTAEGCS